MTAATFEERASVMLEHVERSPFIAEIPSGPQLAFLLLDDREALYGGAAGGGKSSALLMDALLYAHVPGYKAILFRRTFPELNASDGLIERSREWLTGTGARYNKGEKRWTFPSGATLSFGYMNNDEAIPDRGPAYQYIGYDELTTFREAMYRRMFSRLRGPKEGPVGAVPWRMRGASNPGGIGHAFVKERFVDDATALDERTGKRRPFVRARVQDNPGLDVDAYEEGLRAGLDPITLARMLEGDWEILEGGMIFERGTFELVKARPPGRTIRSWDCAATEGANANYTAGVRMSKCAEGHYWIDHAEQWKKRPGPRDKRIVEVAAIDAGELASIGGSPYEVIIELEGGSAGIKQKEDHVRMLSGYTVDVLRETGDKFVRAGPLASQASIGNVKIVEGGPWVGMLLDHLQSAQPGSKFLDLMDAASAAFNRLALTGGFGAYTGNASKRKAGRPKRSMAPRQRMRPTR